MKAVTSSEKVKYKDKNAGTFAEHQVLKDNPIVKQEPYVLSVDRYLRQTGSYDLICNSCRDTVQSIGQFQIENYLIMRRASRIITILKEFCTNL